MRGCIMHPKIAERRKQVAEAKEKARLLNGPYGIAIRQWEKDMARLFSISKDLRQIEPLPPSETPRPPQNR